MFLSAPVTNNIPCIMCKVLFPYYVSQTFSILFESPSMPNSSLSTNVFLFPFFLKSFSSFTCCRHDIFAFLLQSHIDVATVSSSYVMKLSGINCRIGELTLTKAFSKLFFVSTEISCFSLLVSVYEIYLLLFQCAFGRGIIKEKSVYLSFYNSKNYVILFNIFKQI